MATAHAAILMRPLCKLGHGKIRACEKRLPLLKSADNVYILKHQSNILRAPLSLERALEAPMAMVFVDKSYACEFQYQFDPTAELKEIPLGELETYAHTFNLPLKIIFPSGEHVVRPPRRDLSFYRPMLETLYQGE